MKNKYGLFFWKVKLLKVIKRKIKLPSEKSIPSIENKK